MHRFRPKKVDQNYYCLTWIIKVKVAQMCPTLCDPMDCTVQPVSSMLQPDFYHLSHQPAHMDNTSHPNPYSSIFLRVFETTRESVQPLFLFHLTLQMGSIIQYACLLKGWSDYQHTHVFCYHWCHLY